MFIDFCWEHPQVFAGRPEALETSSPPCRTPSSTVAGKFAKPRTSTFSLLSSEEHVAPERFPHGDDRPAFRPRTISNCYRDNENQKQIARESFKPNKPNLLEAEAVKFRSRFLPRTG